MSYLITIYLILCILKLSDSEELEVPMYTHDSMLYSHV